MYKMGEMKCWTLLEFDGILLTSNSEIFFRACEARDLSLGP